MKGLFLIREILQTPPLVKKKNVDGHNLIFQQNKILYYFSVCLQMLSWHVLKRKCKFLVSYISNRAMTVKNDVPNFIHMKGRVV